MIDQDKLVDEFAGLTIVTKDQARVFLEKADWDLKTAVARYQSDDVDNSRNNIPGPTFGSSYSLNMKSTPRATASKPTKHSGNASRSTRSSNIRTLNDVASRDTESGDQAPQNFFTGGEKSGMLVQDPSKQDKGKRVVEEILKKAAAGGPPSKESDDNRHSKPTYFPGSGHTLSSEKEASVVKDDTALEPVDESLALVTRHLTFWRNGFSVDDGPLLRYDDPANSAMLNAINSGRAPLSLLNVQHGQPVDVTISKRQHEDYIPPPKAPPKPFEGNGHRLGSPVTTSLGTATATTATTPDSSTKGFEIDANQPTTSIQIRLCDGSRLVAKFNLTNTVDDIRRFIDIQQHGQRSYILQTTFPVKQLTNGGQSIKDAGLLNSVIVQRLA